MTVRLYNSLTRSVEELSPRNPPKLDMFVCGPTVYDFVHLGNARTFTVFDIAVKWLRHRGFTVNYLQNITDVDDKIIARARQAGRDPLEYAREYEKYFMEDMKSVGNTAVTTYARATDHIPQVTAQVKSLIAKGFVYLIEGDGWYYDLSKFPDYGKLSGRTALAAEDAVTRIDDSDKKRNAGDFCVWKMSKPGEPLWHDDGLGDGRPGWHIEDTAITEHYFGSQYDLHGGGIDLKFPHHEAEIAQQEAASGKVPFVRHWMHAGFLQTGGGKMSKSVGNIISLRDALKRYSAEALRYFFLSAHWREPLELSDDALDAASSAVQRIVELQQRLDAFSFGSGAAPLADYITRAKSSIAEAMDDDLNTPRAFGGLFELVGTVNKTLTDGISAEDADGVRKILAWASDVFGIVPADSSIPDDVRALVRQRETAREEKNWADSDRLRIAIYELGYSVSDSDRGTIVVKK